MQQTKQDHYVKENRYVQVFEVHSRGTFAYLSHAHE